MKPKFVVIGSVDVDASWCVWSPKINDDGERLSVPSTQRSVAKSRDSGGSALIGSSLIGGTLTLTENLLALRELSMPDTLARKASMISSTVIMMESMAFRKRIDMMSTKKLSNEHKR